MFKSIKKKVVAGALLTAMIGSVTSNVAPTYAAQDAEVDTAVVQQLLNYSINKSTIKDTNAPYKIYFVQNSGEVKDMTPLLQFPVKEMDNRSALAVRDMERLVGAKIDWNGKYKIALANQSDPITANTNTVYFPINRKAYAINGVVKPMDTSAAVHNKFNRTYIPLRYLSEALGFQVQFVDKDSSIWIGKNEKVVKDQASKHKDSVASKPTSQPANPSKPTPQPANPSKPTQPAQPSQPSPKPNGDYKAIASKHFDLINSHDINPDYKNRKLGRYAEWNKDFSLENLSFLRNQVISESRLLEIKNKQLSPEGLGRSKLWKKVMSFGGPSKLTDAQKQFLNDRIEYRDRYPGSVYNLTIVDKFSGDRYMLDQYGTLMNIDRPGRDNMGESAVYPSDNGKVHDSVLDKHFADSSTRKEAGVKINRNADINKIFKTFKDIHNKNTALNPLSSNVVGNLDKMEVYKVTPTTKFGAAGFSSTGVRGGSTGLEHIFLPIMANSCKLVNTSWEQYGSFNSKLGHRHNLSGSVIAVPSMGILYEDGTVKTSQDPMPLEDFYTKHGRIKGLLFFNDDPNYETDTAYYVNYQEYWTGNKTLKDISGGLIS